MKSSKHRKVRLGRWTAAGVIGLVVVAFALIARAPRTEYRHPHPRPDVTSAGVMRDFMLSGFPESRTAYAIARAEPALLDGLFCYCNCKMSLGHRSLLDCFQELHGAGCDVCQQEAVIAGTGFARGESLDMIRRTIDETFGGG